MSSFGGTPLVPSEVRYNRQPWQGGSFCREGSISSPFICIVGEPKKCSRTAVAMSDTSIISMGSEIFSSANTCLKTSSALGPEGQPLNRSNQIRIK